MSPFAANLVNLSMQVVLLIRFQCLDFQCFAFESQENVSHEMTYISRESHLVNSQLPVGRCTARDSNCSP